MRFHGSDRHTQLAASHAGAGIGWRGRPLPVAYEAMMGTSRKASMAILRAADMSVGDPILTSKTKVSDGQSVCSEGIVQPKDIIRGAP